MVILLQLLLLTPSSGPPIQSTARRPLCIRVERVEREREGNGNISSLEDR